MIEVCDHCGELIEYSQDELIWDESGYMYSTKLVRCKSCGKLQVVYRENDSWMSEYPEEKTERIEERNGKFYICGETC